MTQFIEIETKTCPECGQSTFLTVPKDAYDSWKRGQFIQVAMPMLSNDEREMLITGYDSECWDKIFGDLND